MSIRMHIPGRKMEILLSQPFAAIRNILGENEISYSSDETIPHYCTVEYKAKVHHIREAINQIISENPDFYGAGKPIEEYYTDLLMYIKGMNDNEYLEYEAI